MSARKPGVTRPGRFIRGLRFDRNPLRRTTDRVETAVLTLLVAAFVVGAPFSALATGAWVHGMARHAQLTQEASRRQVPAVVLTVTTSAEGAKLVWQAQARWRAPDGQEVTRQIPVPSGTTAGGTLRVWTDRSGDITTAPLLDSQVADQTAIAEVAGVIVPASILTLAGAVARWRLNRRRMAAWDADWKATGPRWTTRA
jgi:hypothetical protein